MDNLVNGFKKIARLIVVICLFVLAALEIIALINEIGGDFFPSFYNILKTFLLLLMYLVPAILLAVKKDKEGFVVLSFLLGYLVIGNTLGFLAQAALIRDGLEAFPLIRLIVLFVLGVLLAIVLICFYLSKGFKLNTMKLGNVLLVFTFMFILVCTIINIIYFIVEGIEFKVMFMNTLNNLISPLIVVFGLLLVGDSK